LECLNLGVTICAQGAPNLSLLSVSEVFGPLEEYEASIGMEFWQDTESRRVSAVLVRLATNESVYDYCVIEGWGVVTKHTCAVSSCYGWSRNRLNTLNNTKSAGNGFHIPYRHLQSIYGEVKFALSDVVYP
jgi:hypothetical protein